MASSKRQTTQYNHWLNIKNGLSSIYSQAIAYRLSHDRIVEKLSALYLTNSYKRLTVYHLGYARGLNDGYMADIWQNHVVWMLGPASGPTRIVHAAWTEEMSVLCRIPGALYGGHFWTDDDGKPTDRVFTDYKPTNGENR
jgi:hypothetical protein